MSTTHHVGILGCGDFLRWMTGPLQSSQQVKVTALFDLDPARAAAYAATLGGQVVDSDTAIFDDPDIDTVLIFVPPWARKDLMLRAAARGKNILTTKPLCAQVKDGVEMLDAVEDKVRCGVIYGRTGNSSVETMKRVLDGGEVGRLALYRHEWIHHYPQWNTWATDPEKNGGPFMDAMIHNLNAARYLMGRPATHCTYFSENHAHPDLPCNDTELMKLDFVDRGSAYLFITWAADLAVYSTEGNDREHIDIFYMVTDQGWRITQANNEDGRPVIVASKEGQVREWPIAPLPGTLFDRFADAVDAGAPLPPDIPDIRMAYEDIKLLRTVEQQLGCRVAVNL